MRLACRLAALALMSALVPAGADAAVTTSLKVAFWPDRPGRSTSISFSARVAGSSGALPAPLTKLTVRYPSVLGVAVSGLGLRTCARTQLEARGPRGCPANSLMGRGSVVVAVPFGPEAVEEEARVTIVRAPQLQEGIALFFYAEGTTPVAADILFSGVLSETNSTTEEIGIDVPLVAGLPGGPDVAVVRLTVTIGPEGLTYLERVRGTLVPYRPRGILLPARCPSDGFRFASDFTFADGTSTSSRATVRCSPSRGARVHTKG